MSAEAKHTPGPWEVDGIVLIDGVAVKAGVYWMPDDDDPTDDDLICETSISNARLIAAAPDLLEALRDCLGRFVEAFPASAEYEPIKRGFAAIAKAEGRS